MCHKKNKIEMKNEEKKKIIIKLYSTNQRKIIWNILYMQFSFYYSFALFYEICPTRAKNSILYCMSMRVCIYNCKYVKHLEAQI